jgi:hypothetical protein
VKETIAPVYEKTHVTVVVPVQVVAAIAGGAADGRPTAAAPEPSAIAAPTTAR